MKYKWVIAFVFVVMLISLVHAESDLNTQITQAVTSMNADMASKDIPSPLNTLIGNVAANIRIATSGNEIVVGLQTEDKKFKSISMGAVENPDLEIYTDELTLIELLSGNNQIQTLKNALDDKKITYKGVGFFNKAKFMFLGILIDFVPTPEENPEDAIVSFEDCVASGNNVTGINPQECKTKGGKLFTRVPPVPVEEPVNVTPTETAPVVPSARETRKVVNLIEGGFAVDKIDILVGDTIEWKNVRDGKMNKAMIVGSTGCEKVKSSIYLPGKSYEYTFTKPVKCVIVDGIFTTQTMKVVVDEP
ncbi:hypothetical protein J4444_02110 [Candidatus Woesearchaeota archaeon]|nr:hypothetical protein [Candidatus Woesearchaeota archaeon]